VIESLPELASEEILCPQHLRSRLGESIVRIGPGRVIGIDTQGNLLDVALHVVLPRAPQMYVRDKAAASTLKVIGKCTNTSVTAVDANVDAVIGYIRQLEPLGVLLGDRYAAVLAQVVFITCQ
jgi:hypothetical protein